MSELLPQVSDQTVDFIEKLLTFDPTKRISVKDSMQIQIAKKQLQTFNQQLKDMMLMQGLSADYNEIMDRVEESRLAHEKELKRKRLLRKQRIEFAKTFGLIFGTAFMGFIIIMGTILIIF